MSRWIATGVIGLVIAGIVGIAGCSDSSDSTRSTRPAPEAAPETAKVPPPSEETAGSEEAAANEETAERAAEPVDPTPVDDGAHDLGGVTVKIGDDGSITVSGEDQWGERLDTTYASLEFFTNAAPVLRRAITEEQGRALDALLQELSATGPESL